MRDGAGRKARGVIQISIAEGGSPPATMRVELDERGGDVEARGGSVTFLVHVPRLRDWRKSELRSTVR